MKKELYELLEQLDRARKDTRVIDRDKANNYYNAIIELQTQLKKQQKINKKAIEYIENETYYSALSGEAILNLQNDNYYKLLSILEDKKV